MTGRVAARSAETVNPNMATGAVEVVVDELEVLNTAAPLPFPIDERVNVDLWYQIPSKQ